VFGVPAFFRSADTTAAASAFSFAIWIYLCSMSSALSIGSSPVSSSAYSLCSSFSCSIVFCSFVFFPAGTNSVCRVALFDTAWICVRSPSFNFWSVVFVGTCVDVVFFAYSLSSIP
jgi:hypothetical protein